MQCLNFVLHTHIFKFHRYFTNTIIPIYILQCIFIFTHTFFQLLQKHVVIKINNILHGFDYDAFEQCHCHKPRPRSKSRGEGDRTNIQFLPPVFNAQKKPPSPSSMQNVRSSPPNRELSTRTSDRYVETMEQYQHTQQGRCQGKGGCKFKWFR